MGLQERLGVCVQLGHLFSLVGWEADWPGYACGLNEAEYLAFNEAVVFAQHRNAWFTPESVRSALKGLASMLQEDGLRAWVGNYAVPEHLPGAVRTIGIITAGNLPLVGFHDLLCVLLSGHRARLKVSRDDAGLTQATLLMLGSLAPEMAALITVAEQAIGPVDAIIATGSNNTARHFEHYFGHLPRIIRKNRTSVAVLDGTETDQELTALGEDIFLFFGLGCRNVSKLYLPADFDLDRIFKAIYPWEFIGNHNKWANNYEYHKAIWLMDRVPLIENGFVLFREDSSLHSPLGSLYYERYTDRSLVEGALADQAQQLQSIIGHGHLPFGTAQTPGPGDYADGVDTLKFLVTDLV
jgi:Acyl-CoA reductase (LuxC)